MSSKLMSTGLITLLAGGLALAAQINERDRWAANLALSRFGASIMNGRTNGGAEIRAVRSHRDESGTTHVRFRMFHKGLRVFEAESVAHVAPSGDVELTGELPENISVDVVPEVTEQEAKDLAAAAVSAGDEYTVESQELEILPRGRRFPREHLVWHLRIRFKDATDLHQQDVFIDAHSKEVVWQFNSLQTIAAVGYGRTMYSGGVSLNTDNRGGTFYLRDLTRSGNETQDMQHGTRQGILVEDRADDFGDGSRSNSDADTAAADAHYALAVAWDYFKNVHNRNGPDYYGRKVYNRVHYDNGLDNAFWSANCFCLTFGDGGPKFYSLVSLDIVGHELTHGVTENEANLTYTGESGGLNEATSDIFGSQIELYANNPNDQPDYWIGERALRANWASGSFRQEKALRYMDDPAKDGSSPACWFSGIGNLNVHNSSGPANHMFFLLANGGASKCNGQPVGGIGNAKAAKIWFRALAYHMNPATDYSGARSAALASAGELYGKSSAEYRSTAAAFNAINVVR